MCLESDELMISEEPIMPENPTLHQQKMWDLQVAAVVKNYETLRQNICSLYVVMMSLCDTKIKIRL